MSKHVPIRTCIGCRKTFPKRQLLRFVLQETEGIQIDERQQLPGRGAYLCRSGSCLQKAKRTRALDRAFRTRLPATCYETLAKYVTHGDA